LALILGAGYMMI